MQDTYLIIVFGNWQVWPPPYSLSISQGEIQQCIVSTTHFLHLVARTCKRHKKDKKKSSAGSSKGQRYGASSGCGISFLVKLQASLFTGSHMTHVVLECVTFKVWDSSKSNAFLNRVKVCTRRLEPSSLMGPLEAF